MTTAPIPLPRSQTAVAPEHPAEPPKLTDPLWRNALAAVVADVSVPVLHAQCIVDLTSGRVAGYELLARFPGPLVAPPDTWFAAADHWGVGATLQARVVRRGLGLRSVLPADTFLTINVDPHLLACDQVLAALASCDRGTAEPLGDELARVVVELTEHSLPVDWSAFTAALASVRARGGLVAVDDAGTGYAGLAQLIDVRPHMIKVDRQLVAGIAKDPVKRALVEMLGELAGRMDSWLLAEGIETKEDLDALISLGVPLGQGWALGRAQADAQLTLEADMVDHIRLADSRRVLRDHVASLIEHTPVATAADDDVELVVDRRGRPESIRFGEYPDWAWAPPLVVAPSAPLAEVARRAMARPSRFRFAPLVCTDAHGSVLGLIRIDALLSALARSSASAG